MKFVGIPTVTFAEFPDEISLNYNISNCPGTCERCSEPELRHDIGTELTENILAEHISTHPGITMIGFMGGDRDHKAILKFSEFIHMHYPRLKVGFYSGLAYLNLELAKELDYYKIGEFRMFKGTEDTWKDQTAGPICLPTSNQVMFKRVDDHLVNITDKFRKKKINNWKSVIL